VGSAVVVALALDMISVCFFLDIIVIIAMD